MGNNFQEFSLEILIVKKLILVMKLRKWLKSFAEHNLAVTKIWYNFSTLEIFAYVLKTGCKNKYLEIF